MSDNDCIFCKIVSGEIPSTRVYEDDAAVAFSDLSPQAPVHILIVPKVHVDSLDKASDPAAIGRLLTAAAQIARRDGFAENGYRIVINTNADGGQTVFHLHVHLLAGRPFIFPPG